MIVERLFVFCFDRKNSLLGTRFQKKGVTNRSWEQYL